MRAIVYVDGFNLYYGACRAPGRKWLDLGALCERLLPNDEIIEIAYCTADLKRDPRDPEAQVQQRVYHRALQTIPHLVIYRGRFLLMLADGFNQRYEHAALVSNDGDLKMPVEIIRTRLDLPVTVINPVLKRPGRKRSSTLSPKPLPPNAGFIQLRAKHLKECQFPPEMRSAQGARLVKPAGW